MSRLLVEGRLVDPEWGVRQGQVLIENGRITRVGDGLGRPDLAFGDECLVFPGFGDIHVHLREGQEYKEDYVSGSAAALAGGVTFCLDMPNNPVPPVDPETMAQKQAKVGHPPIDIGLYAATGPGTQPFGHPHYKCFMAHSIGPLYFEKLSQIGPALEPYRGCQITFHCEDPEMLTEGKSHEENRPPEAEAAAVKVAIELARKLDLKANIAHLSTASGLELLLDHPHITREVTPTHLFFDTENRHRFERSELLKMNPPLRGPEHRKALLEAFKKGQIHFLATDHAPHTLEEKTTTNPSGVPHLDTYGLFVSWLLVEQGIEPARIARHACLLPGQFVGKKLGRLAEGYSGDVAVLNLARPTTVRAEQLHTKAGWSPFEGVTLPGSLECT
ncbi:MAG: dihydroorotase family protein, partial [Candidatus Eremiobacteraeota bacterium]|nr:dihydroorotase family protein [Candidatus Eremiobacteraeota bacterium]